MEDISRDNSTSIHEKPVILLVDDDLAARMQVRFSLENEGFEVVEAEDGPQALELAPKTLPDLILLDVVMPGMDGFEVCSTLRTLPETGHTPIVMVTALEDAKTITLAFDAGATDFIVKPLNLLILGYRVRYWIRSGSTLNAFRTNQLRLFKAQDIARLGHWELNLDDSTFQFTCNAPEILGLSAHASYQDLFDGIGEEQQDSIRQQLDEAYRLEHPFSISYQRTLQDGTVKVFVNQGEIVTDQRTGNRFAVGIVQDITRLHQAEDQVRYLAYYDKLTGLANRSYFREHWTKVKPQATKQQANIAVLFIDLDHFKRINDTLGHNAGDKALIYIADKLSDTLHQSDLGKQPGQDQSADLISRVGSDEFCLLVTNFSSPNQLASLAERLINALSTPFKLEGQMVTLTASVGISVYPDDGEDIDSLLKNADTAMSEAKERGRDNYQFFQAQMNDAARERFTLNNRLHRALANNEFQLHYQPQYTNSGGKISGVEALIRWNDPEHGMVRPDLFLPFAEDNGFIDEINTWVIRHACTQAKEWLNAGLFQGCRMAINISGKRLDFKNLEQLIKDTLQETGLSPTNLEIELTERVMMVNINDALEMLANLKAIGISIAIDDFGTGYSALSHLQLFPLTTLKIDKSFIQNMHVKDKSLELVKSIIGIAKSFDLKVVAEGVETEDQRSTLGTMACDDLQGFLLSRPVPHEELTARLKELQEK